MTRVPGAGVRAGRAGERPAARAAAPRLLRVTSRRAAPCLPPAPPLASHPRRPLPPTHPRAVHGSPRRRPAAPAAWLRAGARRAAGPSTLRISGSSAASGCVRLVPRAGPRAGRAPRGAGRSGSSGAAALTPAPPSPAALLPSRVVTAAGGSGQVTEERIALNALLDKWAAAVGNRPFLAGSLHAPRPQRAAVRPRAPACPRAIAAPPADSTSDGARARARGMQGGARRGRPRGVWRATLDRGHPGARGAYPTPQHHTPPRAFRAPPR
jgi:hypothetical protein